MQPTSDFELAQKRLKDRQRNQSWMLMWLVVLIGMILANAAFGLGECWFILEICVGITVVAKFIQLYYGSPRRPIRDDLIAREMEWLFDIDWRQITGAKEYTFAQDRIRKRRLDRWLYGFSFLFLIPTAVTYIAIIISTPRGAPAVGLCIALPISVAIIFAIRTGWNLFSPESVLAKRERKVGDALRLELQRMHPPEKLKNEDKPKRSVKYTVGDDGELIEVDSPDEDTQDKPKHDRL